MVLNKPQIARLKLFLVSSLILFCSFLGPAQSETLEKYIKEKLLRVDENIQQRQYDQALVKVEEIESYIDYIKNDGNRLSVALKKAKIFYGKKNSEEAIKVLLNGLEELEGTPKLLNLKIKYANYLGDIFKNERNYSKSKFYHRISLKESRIINDTSYILKSYLAIGLNHYEEQNIDSAVYYYNEVTEYPMTDDTGEMISNAFNNLNVVAVDEENFELAEEYGNKSIEIKEKLKDSLGIAITLMNLGSVLYKKGEFNKVKKNYLEAYDAAKLLNGYEAILLKENLLYNLAYVNEELKDFEKAYKYLEKASELTDSLSRARGAQNISEIEAKYNVAQEAQKAEEAKSQALRAKVQFYGLALAFLAVIALGYIYYRNYRLKQQSKLEQIENETQTKIINATIDAKEKERKSIAETLHDSVSALLSSANLHLQATKSQLKKEAPQEISKAQVIVNEASVKIRDLSHELISSVLLKFGLAFAVHDMCQKYSNSEITLHSDDNGVKRYDQDFEIKIHNIVEELVNNILKHSKASNATIMLANRENDMLSIRISDDGVGFDVKTARNKDGLGLSHINARVKVMQGVFNIVSSKSNGTSIFILVPIQHKKIVA